MPEKQEILKVWRRLLAGLCSIRRAAVHGGCGSRRIPTVQAWFLTRERRIGAGNGSICAVAFYMIIMGLRRAIRLEL
jgi:hypothetical protein